MHSAKAASRGKFDSVLEGEDAGELQLARASNRIGYDANTLAGEDALRRPRSDLSEGGG
jgi:hypothetical protein